MSTSRQTRFNQDLFEDSGDQEPSAQDAAIAAAAMAALYPHVAELAMVGSHEGVLGRCDDDIEFEFGLDLILDGLEGSRAR